MTLKKILAYLMAIALIAGLPAAGYASAMDGADCGMAATTVSGCCGAAGMSNCAAPCSMSAGVVGAAAPDIDRIAGCAPRAKSDTLARVLAGPPDTAPPKSFCA